MKKIALTSLLAMIAVSGAHAANVIDGNPIYMPKKGHFYSVTSVESHTKRQTPWALGEDFGFGISDKLAVEVSTSATENDNFDYMAWDDMALQLTFRALDAGAFKLDVLGGYGVTPVWDDHRPFLKKEDTSYGWVAGLRAGFTTGNFTIAGTAEFMYLNSESFNWADKGMHYLALGLDAQFVIDNNWNLVAGATYTGVLNDKWAYDDMEGGDVKNAGTWHGEFGVNYNIDATKFVGAYISGDMHHHGGTKGDEWKAEKGFGFGAKFGIDF